MLEKNSRAVSIKKLAIDDLRYKNGLPFDVNNFISESDLNKLNQNLAEYSSFYHVEKFGWETFSKLCLSLSISYPNALKKIKASDELFVRMKNEKKSNFLSPANGKRIKDPVFLSNFATVKLLFGEKVKELEEYDQYERNTLDRILKNANNPFSSSLEITSFLSSAIVFPHHFQNKIEEENILLREQGIAVLKDKIENAIEGNKNNQYERPNSFLLEWNLYARLFYSNRPDLIKLNDISWSKFSKEVRDEEDQYYLDFWKNLSNAKLLLADEIKYTDKGIVTSQRAIFQDPSLNNIPNRRAF